MGDKVRIYKYEKSDGTYYYPQRYVYKSRWFSESGYEWETFSWRENGACITFDPMFCQEKLFKDIKVAEYHCKKYLRVYHGSSVVVVYKIEE
jgi:hypothetical protein